MAVLLTGSMGLFGMGGIIVGTIYQAAAGSVTYRHLQEELETAEKEFQDWQDKYNQLYSEYVTLQINMESQVQDIARQTAFLRDQTQDIVIELNQKAIVINWLWFSIILIAVFLMIFKRFKVGRFFLEIINYPFLLFFIAIVNGFLYLFGAKLYPWPKNPFAEENDTNSYSFKMKTDNNHKKLNFFVILIIIFLIFIITYLLLYFRYKKENEYFRDLYDDPKYNVYTKYSVDNRKKHKEKREQKKKQNFKFNKKYDMTYRWETFEKDLNIEFGSEGTVCCNEPVNSQGNKPTTCQDTTCMYTSKGFTAISTQDTEKNSGNKIWRVLKGVRDVDYDDDGFIVSQSTHGKTFEGSSLFE